MTDMTVENTQEPAAAQDEAITAGNVSSPQEAFNWLCTIRSSNCSLRESASL